jgi:DNA-binding NtrC family response regulator
MIGKSKPMQELYTMLEKIKSSESTVLVNGENGTGKELIAKAIHYNSSRKDMPFVTVNCSAIPENLIESEFFGHEKGAFTGADSRKIGKFQYADGGTLFLDEIGNLPLNGQVKLLRVLETGRFERLGSPQTRQAKVRVVSATNADLASMVRQGLFREDLLYRLQGIELRVPPLSERLDDLKPLAQQVLDQHGRTWDDLSAPARQALMAHAWPGNVRELRHTMARACVLAGDGPIDVVHLALPPATATGTPPSTWAQASSGAPSRWPAFDTAQGMSPRDPDNHRNLDEPPRERIVQAMAAAQGVVSRAASALGLSRQALYRRLEHFGLSEAAARPPRDPSQPA